ncbi:hypothetical protein A2165_00385 [Candidatus Curtissbacteria bacterium RBG_13_40_7]|uniref:Uncharacterized protein n=1 Tax=Candidatus Curtissbacteria bacterium RBG_13_40_7 TaxID=1797706 RepID=A0A1F5FTF3_9BACT|nr:MAG: hypothetical protein A2165_00385 [Candidatus Curtissbacteria bacterium RBG_13_40_7]
MLEEKFVCPFCGFESNGPGLCPTCDKNLEKVCHCGSGKFSAECCQAKEEDKTAEKMIQAEVAGEALKERAKEDEEKQKEEEELANVKPIDEE